MAERRFFNPKLVFFVIFLISFFLGISSFPFIEEIKAEEIFIQNHSFESGLEGWKTNSSDAISVIKDIWAAPDGRQHRLDYNFYDKESNKANTFQTISNLENGEYFLAAYFANSGFFTQNYMYAKSGENTFKVDIPIADQWVKIELPIVVENNSVTIGIFSKTEEEAWLGIDVVTLKKKENLIDEPTPEPEGFIKGVDISSLTKVEDYGGKFYDQGDEKDAIEIFSSYGANYARLVIWKDPYQSDGYNDLEDTIRKAKRIKAAGMKLLLNFHYSDTWADPGNQNIPKVWSHLSFDALVEAVYDYTSETLAALYAEGIVPDMVQIGNEIRPGMLFPHGKIVNNDFSHLAQLLNSGIQAVRDSAEGDTIQIMLHLDEGGNNDAYRWWFDGVIREGVTDFQVIGASYYPYWHGTLEDLENNLNDISEWYDKDVIVVETAYGFTLDDADGHGNIFNAYTEEVGGYPATEAGQARFLYDLLEVIKNIPNGRGVGFFYWEPAWLGVKGAGWISGEGNAWENQAMFDFDGHALESLSIFTEGYVAPEAKPRPDEQDEEDPFIEGLELLSKQKSTNASSSAGDGGGIQNAPENAVDGNAYTSWGTDEGAGAWWEVDLEELSFVERIRFHFWDGIKEIEIEISDNGVEYSSLGKFEVTQNRMDYHLPSKTVTRYIRITIKEATSNWVGFMEFLAYGHPDASIPDKIAPETTMIVEGDLKDGKYIGEVKIILEAIDNESGVKRIEYSLDQGKTWLEFKHPIIVQTVGDHHMLYRAIDRSGNVEEAKDNYFSIIEVTDGKQPENGEEDTDKSRHLGENDEEGVTDLDKTDNPDDSTHATSPDEEGEILPNTASFHFNALLAGLISIIMGTIVCLLHLWKRKMVQ